MQEQDDIKFDTGLPHATQLSRVEIQRRLPEGLILGSTISKSHHSETFTAEDQRLSAESPVTRIVRVIEVGLSESWRANWLRRVSDWAAVCEPHIAKPIEFGWIYENHAYLVFDRMSRPLSDLIPESGIVRKIGLRLIRELTQGLAELHSTFGAHGDFRADHLYVDTDSLTDSTRIWIGDVDEGAMAWWSENRRVPVGAADAFPPEWGGNTLEPSKVADVYALGCVACEILVGMAATRRWRVHGSGHKLPHGFANRAPLSWKWLWFPAVLATNSRSRPADGVAVRLIANRIELGKKALEGSLAILLMLAICVGLSWHILSERGNKISNLEKQLADAKRSVHEFQERLNELKPPNPNVPESEPKPERSPDKEAQMVWQEVAKRIDGTAFGAKSQREFQQAMETRIKDVPIEPIRKQLAEWKQSQSDAFECVNNWFTKEQRQPKAPLTKRETAFLAFRSRPWEVALREEVARATWSDLVRKHSCLREGLRRIGGALGETTEGLPIAVIPVKNPFRKEYLANWWKQTRERMDQWSRWENEPQEAFEKVATQPWDSTAAKTFEASRWALIRAESIWLQFANRDELSWQEFRNELETSANATGNPAVGVILSRWINAFSTLGTFRIRLAETISPSGWGTYRQLEISLDATKAYGRYDGTKWSNVLGQQLEDDVLPLSEGSWKPNQKIIVQLYGERTPIRIGIRPCLIDQTIKGPVALWRLKQLGEIRSGDHVLKFDVLDCPGPPRFQGSLLKDIVDE